MSLKAGWINFLYRVATGSRTVRNLFTPVGALVYASIITLFILAGLQADKLFGLPGLVPKPVNIIISVPVLLFGFFMMGWSFWNFLKVKGTPVPFNPPPSLVTSGPYGYVRNPMLSGLFLLLFGLGVLLRSISLVVFFTPAFIALNVWELKAIEEPELEKRLGEAYVRYKKRTPMFIPGFRKNSGKHV